MKKISRLYFWIYIIVAIVIVGILGFIIYRNIKISPSVNFVSILTTKKNTTEKPITFTIAGDAMFGRAIAWKWNNYVTKSIEPLGQNYFGGADVGILNLEGPISSTEFKSNPNPDNLIFNFPPQSVDALKYLGVNAVSSANNHSQNQGIAGLNTTKQLLSDANIADIGSQTSINNDNIKEFGKLTVITVNLVGQDFDITNSIKSEKAKGQIILIFPHWGSEYQTTHSSEQSRYAHSWIDSGADIVIGSHPHVVQDAEIYQNKPIFYSLGNLIFDQPFSIQTQRGLILKVEMSDKQIKINIIPTIISGSQVGLATGAEKDTVINKFKSELGAEKFIDDSIMINTVL